MSGRLQSSQISIHGILTHAHSGKMFPLSKYCRNEACRDVVRPEAAIYWHRGCPAEGTSLEDEFVVDGAQRAASGKAGALSTAASSGIRKGGKTRSSAPLKRGRASMTLRELIEANVISPGRNKISVVYKGTNHQASLNKDGLIVYQGGLYPITTFWPTLTCHSLTDKVVSGLHGTDLHQCPEMGELP